MLSFVWIIKCQFEESNIRVIECDWWVGKQINNRYWRYVCADDDSQIGSEAVCSLSSDADKSIISGLQWVFSDSRCVCHLPERKSKHSGLHWSADSAPDDALGVCGFRAHQPSEADSPQIQLTSSCIFSFALSRRLVTWIWCTAALCTFISKREVQRTCQTQFHIDLSTVSLFHYYYFLFPFPLKLSPLQTVSLCKFQLSSLH